MNVQRPQAVTLRSLLPMLALAAVAIGGWVYLLSDFYHHMRPDAQLLVKFGQIQPGTTRQAVIGQLGTPAKQSRTFHLTQLEGFERQYAEAGASGASYWLMWHTGFNTTLAVGFDAGDRVVYSAKGDG